MSIRKIAVPAVIMLLALLAASAVSAQTISGKWVDAGNAGNPMFIVTFGAGGSYRAECRDESVCSLCAGGGPVVETGTYSLSDGVATITITSSNAPNSSLRLNRSFDVAVTLTSENGLKLSNAGMLTFDWASTPTVGFVSTATGVEKTTWRAVKELFK